MTNLRILAIHGRVFEYSTHQKIFLETLRDREVPITSLYIEEWKGYALGLDQNPAISGLEHFVCKRFHFHAVVDVPDFQREDILDGYAGSTLYLGYWY